MKILVYLTLHIVEMVIVPVLFYVGSGQGTAGVHHNSCIQNYAWLRPSAYNYEQYLGYYNCMAGFESRF